ncbi:MAG: DUF6291 domain-containing protein [Cetobacterium sp.]
MSEFASKKGFILYHDLSLIFHELTNEQAGQLIKNIVNYSFSKTQLNPTEPTGLFGLLGAISKPFINHIDRDFEQWLKMCEKNKNNGKKGGKVPKKKTQPNPSKADTDTDTDKDINKEKYKKENYIFEGKIIKLLERDFNQWKKSFIKIDLISELQGLDDYYSSLEKKDLGNWFTRTSAALAKKNSEKPEPLKKVELPPKPILMDYESGYDYQLALADYEDKCFIIKKKAGVFNGK